MQLELRMPHLNFERILEFELFVSKKVGMDLGSVVDEFLLQVLLSGLLIFNFESFDLLRESERKNWIDVLVLLPFYCIVIRTEVEDLSQHCQSKAFALSDSDALLNFFQGNPVSMSSSEVVQS